MLIQVSTVTLPLFLVLTSQLLIDSWYDHRLHYPTKVFVIFDSESLFFFEMPDSCIHYPVHLTTVRNQSVVFPKLNNEILDYTTKEGSFRIF